MYVFQMGGAVWFFSRNQTVLVATSICENENVSLRSACKKRVWLCKLLSRADVKCKGALRVQSPTNGAIKLVKTRLLASRTAN